MTLANRLFGQVPTPHEVEYFAVGVFVVTFITEDVREWTLQPDSLKPSDAGLVEKL